MTLRIHSAGLGRIPQSTGEAATNANPRERPTSHSTKPLAYHALAPTMHAMKIRDSKSKPTFELESAELSLGHGPICGVDEAGRGPWAGPVTASAVILDPDNIPIGIDDSKAMDEDAREIVFARIMKTAQVAVTIAGRERIDRDNILNATMWAMSKAVAGLKTTPRLALIDGNKLPKLTCNARAIIKGDAKCLSIAAASIIAKVTRDRLMRELAIECPGYGFERHKGYGTPQHKDALKRLGVSKHHRHSFKPIQLALSLEHES